MSSDGANQFDFWLGEWDLTWADNGRGHNSISKILGDRVIREKFTTLQDDEVPPFQGMSVSIYNEAENQWKQTWVDNQGNYLDFIGGFAHDKMMLIRDAVVDDKPIKQRMVWYNIQPDAFDWAWERSEDQGDTWQTLWLIHYVRAK